MGGLAFLDGPEGPALSLVAWDLAARLAAWQPMPDGSREGMGEAVVLCQGDRREATVRSWLQAAGANKWNTEVYSCTADERGNRPLLIPRDLWVIERLIKDETGIMVIDPVGDFLHLRRHDEVKQALYQLDELGTN